MCFDVFRTQHVPVVSRAMERNVETWIFSTIFCVCEGFPTSGKLKRQCAGAAGMQLWLCSFGWWGRWCSLCPIMGVGGWILCWGFLQHSPYSYGSSLQQRSWPTLVSKGL